MQIEEQKPESIRTVGLIIAIFSGFIILSNGIGAVAYSVIATREGAAEAPGPDNVLTFILAHYVEICLLMVVLGFVYLYAAINLRKYRHWANKLVSAISLFLIIFIWTTLLGVFSSVEGTDEWRLLQLAAIASAIVWSTPLGLLIWFLSRENIKKHFV